jgi:hypothetical protein
MLSLEGEPDAVANELPLDIIDVELGKPALLAPGDRVSFGTARK